MLTQNIPSIAFTLFLSKKNLGNFLFFLFNLCNIFETQMISKNYEFSRAVVEMAWIMLSVDYSRLFWLLFGVFSYENHGGKPPII